MPDNDVTEVAPSEHPSLAEPARRVDTVLVDAVPVGAVPVAAAPAEPTGSRRGRTRSTRWGAWLLATLSFFLVLAGWSLATPMVGSPDEYSHVFRAASVVRGEILPPREEGDDTVGSLVLVPRDFAVAAGQVGCFAFQPEVTADCARPVTGDDTLVEVRSTAAQYNPVYYALVGWPDLFQSGEAALTVMRLVSALLCAALLGSAALSLAHGRHGRILLCGLALATTPMVFFVGGMVNPNGVEIAAAVSVWAALIRLATGPEGETARLLRRAAVAAALLVLTRSLSPLWLAVIVVTCLCLARRSVLGEVLRRLDTWLWAGLVAASSAAAVAWTLQSGVGRIPDVYVPPDATLLGAVMTALQMFGYRMSQFVGIFGWTDTPAPGAAVLVYVLLTGGLLVAAWVFGRPRDVLVLSGLAVVVVALPLLLEALQYNRLGPFWQSRYSLPIAVGLPLVAAFVGADRVATDRHGRDRPVPWRLPALVVVSMGAVHALCFVQALIRNQAGLNKTMNPLSGVWHPAAGSATVLAIEAAGLVAIALLTLALPVGTSADRGDPADAAPGSEPPGPAEEATTYVEPEFADDEFDDREMARTDKRGGPPVSRG